MSVDIMALFVVFSAVAVVSGSLYWLWKILQRIPAVDRSMFFEEDSGRYFVHFIR